MRSIRIQEDVGEGFLTLSRDRLAAKLREHGHRFPEARADYIVAARIHAGTLKESLQSLPDETEAREWVVRTFRGIGYKEASHFLRNIGYKSLAIIDFHIIDLLVRHRLIERPKTLTKRRYLDIESVLGGIAGKAGLSLAELDLYLWFMETGKVLK
jgi:N-glycosylase/DNA lyase